MNKKIVKFFTLPIVLSACLIAPLVTTTSCASSQFRFDANFIINAIDAAKSNKDKEIQISGADASTAFINDFKTLSKEQQYQEIAYDLFGVLGDQQFQINEKENENVSFIDLWEDGIVDITSNISNYDIKINEAANELLVTFIGYVKCNFIKDFNTFEAGNYYMYTYSFTDLKIQIEANADGIIYLIYKQAVTDPKEQPIIGVLDYPVNQKQVLIAINEADTSKLTPMTQRNIKLVNN